MSQVGSGQAGAGVWGAVAGMDARRKVEVAAGASILLNVVGLAGFALPGGDEAPAGAIAVGAVLALVALAGAWGLWRGRRWGATTTSAITALNVVASIPPMVEAPSGWIQGFVIVGVVLSVPLLVLLRDRGLRAQLR